MSQPSIEWLWEMIHRASSESEGGAWDDADREYAMDELNRFSLVLGTIVDHLPHDYRHPMYIKSQSARRPLDMTIVEEASAAAKHAYEFTPIDQMADDAWPAVVRAVYPIIARDALSHVITESPEIGDNT